MRYRITFRTVRDNLSFEASSENEDLMNNFIEGILSIFGDLEKKKIEIIHQNTHEINTKINEFVYNFKDKFSPALSNILTFFKRMEVDEYFFFYQI